MPPNGRPEAAGHTPPVRGVVVTATHRLARHLRRSHDALQSAAGLRAWPTPDILPQDAWLQRCWESAVVNGAPAGRLRLLADAESRLVWRRLLAREGLGMDAAVIGKLACSAWRLCQDWEIPPEALAAAAETDDHRAFARWARRYAAELRRHRWTDAGAYQQQLVADCSAGHMVLPEAMAFRGFQPRTPAHARLTEALRLAGCDVLPEQEPPSPVVPRVVTARDETDELARALRWAEGRRQTSPDANLAIVLPDLDQWASRARRLGLDLLAPGWQLREPGARPVALSGGRSLTDYPVVHTAIELLQFAGQAGLFSQASLLLRSPYWGKASREAAGRAHTEVRLRDRLMLTMPAGRLAKLAKPHAPDTAERLAQMAGLEAALPDESLSCSTWAAHWSQVLDAAGWPGDRALTSEEYQATQAWQALLESFAGSGQVLGRLPGVEALGNLVELARERNFEPEIVPGGIGILSLQETVGEHFDGLWVCGLTADRWPPVPRVNALVPLALQRSAGIPAASAPGLRAFSEAQLRNLLSSATEITLSWPQVQDQAEALMSPLLASFGASPGACDAAEDPPPDCHPERTQIAASGRTEILAEDPPGPFLRTGKVRGGTSLLSTQAVCPARAFIEHRLRGRELARAVRPLDSRMRGIIAHRVLAALYAAPEYRHGLHRMDEQALRQRLDALADAVLTEVLPGPEPYLDALRKLEHARLWCLASGLRQLEANWPDFEAQMEQDREVTVGPLTLDIRPDRIDRLPDGRTLVLDYKTGKVTTGGWRHRRLQDCQLPLYAVTGGADGVAFVSLSASGVELRGVGAAGLDRPGIRTPERFFKLSEPDWAGVLTGWRVQLENFATEFAAGDFRVDPRDRRVAAGQFASLTRVYARTGLPDDESADDPVLDDDGHD